MKKIYLNLLVVILSSFILNGCFKTDENPDVPWVAPEEEALEGNGFLKVGVGEDAVTTKSTYEWSLEETTISVNVIVDLNQYINGDDDVSGGNWEIGNFELSSSTVNEFTGVFVSELDETTFYAVEPDGTAVEEMTSYKPGMWVDGDGYSSGWSDGSLYWQWYIWEGKEDKDGDTISYDYSAADNGSLLVIGSNPGNAETQSGNTITSKAKMVVGDVSYDWILSVTFSGEVEEPEEPETEGYPNVPLTGRGYPYPYSCGVSGDHQFSWYSDDDGIYVNADIYTPSIISEGAWTVLGFVIDTTELADALGFNIAGLSDIANFYPVEPDNSAGTEWTSYAPGQWVASDGTAAAWDVGAMFWQYQINGTYYEDHSTEGLFLIGVNPGNISGLDGQTVVSKANIYDKDFIVSVTYHDTYPTSGSGNVGAHTYNWELTAGGVNIEANCSVGLLDESWNWFGFPLNETYINDYYSIDIDALSGDIAAYGNTCSDGFYPVNASDERLDNWSSYGPGMWFDGDGNPSAWDTDSWNNFWQYYTVVEHEIAIPNLFLLGNPVSATHNVSGTSSTSKSILNSSLEWNVTLNIVE